MAEPQELVVVLTGTGTPMPTPGRAGAGVLVRFGQHALQFDAGRGTVVRLAEAGIGPARLSALFLTHHHSDHLVDVPDVVMTRWISRNDAPLPIVTPEGPAARFARRMLDVWDEELQVRQSHARRDTLPVLDVRTFVAGTVPSTVWSECDVVVSAVSVKHEPIEPAVAYRVDTPAGSVVVSGDTRVCNAVAELAAGADVLVHEACRMQSIEGTPHEFVANYHADSRELGGLAAAAGVSTLVLTHLIPPPLDDRQRKLFEEDIRGGGFTGSVIVGSDLERVTVRR